MLAELGMGDLSSLECERFETYLGLILKWNAKMNLTAIRDGETILRRHFVESIECARLLPQGIRHLLDYGSGAGFPGIPCAICRPEIVVTLAESQAKKASFLREAVRQLGLEVEVHAGRVETLPSERRFDGVILRAVDRMADACLEAATRVSPGGFLAIVGTGPSIRALPKLLSEVRWQEPLSLASTRHGLLLLGTRESA